MRLNPVVTTQRQGDIAWVTIDNPPVNATSVAVREGLETAVAESQGARVAVLFCRGRTFIAGGDLSEFDDAPALPHLPDVVRQIEESPTPFLALMHGTVLGGGFEIAMGCAWRIATEHTVFGLPETNVGVIPGAGGTQRLPRLIGLSNTIDVACTGKRLSARDLFDLGGLDLVATGNPHQAAREFIKNLPARPAPLSQAAVTDYSAKTIESRRVGILERAKGQTAPLHALDAVGWSSLPFDKGQEKERALHLKLRGSEQSRALRHAFFAERSVSKPSILEDVAARPISSVAIVGGGLMGAGIAAAFLNANLKVVLIERDSSTEKDARDRVSKLLDSPAKRLGTSATELRAKRDSLTTATHPESAVQSDLVIEAVFEDLDAKRSAFRRLVEVLPETTILATNTSYLDPTQIFSEVPAPDRCVGLHFFSPAHIMKLVEVVQLPDTSAATLATCFLMVRKLGKTPVLCGNCDGFIGNRMLAAYRRAADYILADGALPAQVDGAMRDFGMPMGPYELQDLTGLQIAWANRKRKAAARNPTERYVTIADTLCERGRFGQRAGKGWYRYETNSRTPIEDPEVTETILDYSSTQGIARRPFSDVEISARLLAVLANEGARIVEEGIARNDEAIDVVKMLGYGFPRWRGGPMHYAGEIGWSKTGEIMRQLRDGTEASWPLAFRIAN